MSEPFETIYLTLIRPREAMPVTVEPIHFRTEEISSVLVDSKGTNDDTKGKANCKTQIRPRRKRTQDRKHHGPRTHNETNESDFNRKLIYKPLDY